MNKEQAARWMEAQKISIGVNLVAAAQKQLKFLAAADRRRGLYHSPGLERAIYRYKTCWLPLLAEQSENGFQEGPLVVPLDCEWIWHCHRLNPIQYKMDCERVYGRILDNKNVLSSVDAQSTSKSEELWHNFCPSEPFELDYNNMSCENVTDVNGENVGSITYDLVAAVQRQSSFYYQVSRPFTQDTRFLTAALARYKGFLYLIKSNQDKSLEHFAVPTYDIDIIWHSHQLCPVSYSDDLTPLFGKVLQHDDQVSDKSEGGRLYEGFAETTKQYEEIFGLRYWRAGVMYRGPAPTPLETVPAVFDEAVNATASLKCYCGTIPYPPSKIVQVFLEIIDVKDAPLNEAETLGVYFTMKQPDMHFSGPGTLHILSLTGKKDVASFSCEPTGEIVLNLITKSNSNSERLLGKTSILLEELIGPNSDLSIEKWFKLDSNTEITSLTPIHLRVASSSTLPVKAPLVMDMVKVEESSPQQIPNCRTSFIDGSGKTVAWAQIRDTILQEDMTAERKVIGITMPSEKPLVLAVCQDNKWIFNEISSFSGTAEIKTSQDGRYYCELKGEHHMIKLYWGRRLEYEEECCRGNNNDCACITAVEFSKDHPYGKGIALLDMKSEVINVNEEWFMLPWITICVICMNMKKRNNSNHDKYKKCDSSDFVVTCNSNSVSSVAKRGSAECAYYCGGGMCLKPCTRNGSNAQCGTYNCGGAMCLKPKAGKWDGGSAQCGTYNCGGAMCLKPKASKRNGDNAQCGTYNCGGAMCLKPKAGKRNDVSAPCGTYNCGGAKCLKQVVGKRNDVSAPCGTYNCGGAMCLKPVAGKSADCL